MSDIIKISIIFIPVQILEGRSCQHKATYSEKKHFGNISAAFIFGVFNVSYFIYSAVQQYLLLNLQTSIVKFVSAAKTKCDPDSTRTSVNNCRGSRVESRGSRVESRGSRVKSRGSILTI